MVASVDIVSMKNVLKMLKVFIFFICATIDEVSSSYLSAKQTSLSTGSLYPKFCVQTSGIIQKIYTL